MLAAARGGRQLPRPEYLNVARRTLALSSRGWHGGPRAAAALARSRRRCGSRRSLSKQRLLAHMGKPVGVLVRTADELAAVRDGNPFPPAPGKFTVAIFLDEQPPAR